MAEEERRSLMGAAATSHFGDELAALKKELDEAKNELKKRSGRLEHAILEGAPNEQQQDLKEREAYYLGRVKDLESLIARKEPAAVVAPSPVVKRLKRDTREVKDDFLAKLPLAKWEENVLRFERETHVTRDKILFIRECYRALYMIVLDSVRKGGKCVTTGTPGIGKSFFGYFAVRKLLDDGFTVIHIDMGWDWANLYIPDVPSAGVAEVFAKHGISQLEGPWMGRLVGGDRLREDSRELYGALTKLVGEVIVVLDPPKDFGAEVFVNPECGLLVVTSPSAQRIASFSSFGGTDTFYMPLWSVEELRSLLEKRKGAALSDEENNELGLRVLRFGGVPRFVARSDCDHATMVSRAEKDTKTVLDRLDSASKQDMLDPFNINPQFSGRIVHLLASASFDLAGKRFATEMIERQILVRYWRQDLLTLVNAARGIAGFSSTVGKLNELWWHVAMQEGGPVKLIQLKDKPARNASNSEYGRGPVRNGIIPSTAARYSAKQNLSDVKSLWDPAKSEHGLYFHFLKGNVPLIDSISVLDGNTGKSLFGFESPIPDPPANVSAASTVSSKSKGSRLKYLPGAPASSQTATSSTSAASVTSGNKATSPCVLLNQMTINSDHSFTWTAFSELVDLARRLSPPGTSLHFCWVTSESAARNFHFKFPSGGEPSFVEQIPQWLLIVPDEALARFTTS